MLDFSVHQPAADRWQEAAQAVAEQRLLKQITLPTDRRQSLLSRLFQRVAQVAVRARTQAVPGSTDKARGHAMGLAR